jgi:hypothetical protein
MKLSPRAPRTNRGSKRRLQRIAFRGNWSIEVCIVIGIVLVTLFVVVPWLVRHPPNDLPVRAPTLAQQ